MQPAWLDYALASVKKYWLHSCIAHRIRYGKDTALHARLMPS